MWRSVLLGVVLAGVLAGCSLGGGSEGGASTRAPHDFSGTANLVVTLRASAGGSHPIVRVAHIYCPAPKPVAVGAVARCAWLVKHWGALVGEPQSYTAPRGGSGLITVKGSFDAFGVHQMFRLGQQPQYGTWFRLVFAPSKQP
jgi:hypothetical protein